MRQFVKRVAEATACGIGLPRLYRRARRGDTLVLAYHNIVPDRQPVSGDPSLHLPQREFARQLDLLTRTHDVVPLRETLTPPSSQMKPRVALTFDDATVGALTAGVSELRARDLPATIFVAPHFAEGGAFWWDALVPLTDDVRAHCLDDLAGRDDDVRTWARAQGMHVREVPAHQHAGTEDQLRAVQGDGIEYGSHSWSHPVLTALDDGELQTELERPLEWLRSRFDAVIPWIAYPYGITSDHVGEAARRAGYDAGLRVDGGWLSSARGAYALPRRNVPAGMTRRGFELLTSGVRRRR